MDSLADSGSSRPRRERRAPEGFQGYDLAAMVSSDSEEDDYGAISDGDPPYFAGSTSAATAAPAPVAPAPGPAAPMPLAPVPSALPPLAPSLPSSEASSRKNSTTGSGTGTSTSGGKRTFEELEDIIFSNPKSFVTLAGAIADSRGVQLVISDDRTHKVSSAYMHVTCAYRRSGCNFILKLAKAKEGGWVIKSAKAQEIDTKQRSNYRCRHPAGSYPDTSHGVTVSEWLNRPTTSHPEPGARPKAVKVRSSSNGGTYSPEEEFEQVDSLAGKAARGPLAGARLPTLPIESERALAPPFLQRSLELQAQIAPALPTGQNSPGSKAAYYPAAASGGYASGPQSYRPPQNGASYPAGITPSPQQHPSSHPTSRAQSQRTQLASPATLHTPTVAFADPTALPDWTALIHLLGDPTLLPLARVLASPGVACTPAAFFAPTASDKLRETFLAELPEKQMGLWPKLKLAQLLRDKGRAAWDEVVEQRRRSGDQGYVSGISKSRAIVQQAVSPLGLRKVQSGPPSEAGSAAGSRAVTPSIAAVVAHGEKTLGGSGGVGKAESPAPPGGASSTSAYPTPQPAPSSSTLNAAMDVDPSAVDAPHPSSSGSLVGANPPPPPGAAASDPADEGL
ncbi:hypothetical protein JCM10207_005764 [Rhodosporidiobolus poonsookiae]